MMIAQNWCLFLWVMSSYVATQLIFHPDPRRGSKAAVSVAEAERSRRPTAIQMWKLATAGQPDGGTWENFVLNPILGASYSFILSQGICVPYSFRIKYDTGATSPVYNMSIPDPEFWPDSKLHMSTWAGYNRGLASNIITSADEMEIVAKFNWGRRFRYWTPELGVAILQESPSIQTKGCQSLFPKPVPAPILIKNSKTIKFNEMYAIHNCSFELVMNMTLRYPGSIGVGQLKPSCTRQFTVDKFSFRLICSQIPNTMCDIPDRVCPMDCSPLEVRSEAFSRAGRIGENKNEDIIRISWTFPLATRNLTRKYKVRFAQAELTAANTVANFADIERTDLNREQSSFEYAPSLVSRQDYFVQICALKSDCDRSIDWTREKKYPVLFRNDIVHPAEIIKSASLGSPAASFREISFSFTFLFVFALFMIGL